MTALIVFLSASSFAMQGGFAKKAVSAINGSEGSRFVTNLLADPECKGFFQSSSLALICSEKNR